MQGLKDGHIIAHLAQVARTGQTRRAGADDRHAVAVGGGNRDLDLFKPGLLGHVPVGDKALETADGDGLALHAADTLGFALLLLGADAAADGGQGVGGGDDLIGGLKLTLGDPGDELGDADGDGAAGAAGGILAVEAALGLVDGHLGSVAQGHFVEVAGADDGVLLGHFVLGQSHISHFSFLPSSCRYAGRHGPAPPYRRRRA